MTIGIESLQQQPGESATKWKARVQKLEKELSRLTDKTKYNKIDAFVAMPKQREFFDQGIKFRERMFSAGNQLGKTYAGAAEVVYHATGNYPEDWLGKRFDGPVRIWVCGVSGEQLRDGPQTLLFGKPGIARELGAGLIPKSAIPETPSASRAATNGFDTAIINHKNGGVSTLTFKTYAQGREKFQSDTVDVVWLDEEPDMEIYTEAVTRTNATEGIVFITFTPLKGRTELYNHFEDKTKNTGVRGFVNMTVFDAMSLPAYNTREKIEALKKRLPAHEVQTRFYGVPAMGKGLVFSADEGKIAEDSIPLSRIPVHWHKGWAIDFGIADDHAFAAALLAWDKDVDCIHLIDAFKITGETALQHSVRLKTVGAQLPVIWPHDGTQREKSSGEALASIYRRMGLKMCAEHATFDTGGYSTEAGILEMDDRMRTGRFKVAKHLELWFAEYRMYHRKDGLVVRQNDDLMSATRIGVMARRFLRPVALGRKTIFCRPEDAQICDGAVLSPKDLWG